MKLFNYFWVLFGLYFVVVHPAILYDGHHPPSFLERQNPTRALIYLSIAIVGWAGALAYGWRLLYKYTFGLRNGIRQLTRTGQLVNAKILDVNIKKSTVKEFEHKEVKVSFDNFSNTRIQYTLILTDTKPYLKRYEKGKIMKLRIDRDLKHMPYVIPDDTEVKIKYPKVILLFGLWAMALVGITGCFVYAYTVENQGYGWRFLTWQHPLMLSLIIGIGLWLIYHFFIDKLILSKIAGMKAPKARKLLFYGVQTTAMILQVNQTGTYINEQPEVKFDMTFVDKNDTKHQVSIKKIVSLINPPAQQGAKSIFYLPDSPTTVAFQDDLQA